MRDIIDKIVTQRVATARTTLKMKPETVEAIRTNTTTPKKDVLAIAKAAGFLAVKNTPSVIPHCHPVPVESVSVDYELGEDTIQIDLEAKCIYRTGIEVEAMHGVSIVALTIYDMIKPMDKEVEILRTHLVKKTGGKSDFRKPIPGKLRTAVLVISDSVSAGTKSDKAGEEIVSNLDELGVNVEIKCVVSDDLEAIQARVLELKNNGMDLILTTGGTGLSPRDNTPEALKPLFTKEVESLMEAARHYGLDRTPYAMLSRGVAGFIDQSLVITLPGSSRGARESMKALFPYVFHIFKVQNIGYKHHDIDNK